MMSLDPAATHMVFYGGCLCTHLRYRIEIVTSTGGQNTVTAIHCSCTNCRKFSAGLQATYVSVPPASIIWATREQHLDSAEEQPPSYGGTTYKERIDAVGTARGFCTWCGASVLIRREGEASVLIAAGSLDEPGAVLEGVKIVPTPCGQRPRVLC
ncbi:Mss4-like protein [Tricharina praecox]|uniref:Mss4-like protein n=1 Tax=Tricharina praecox TaxID=43433 RepID=UPI00222061B1|nr:Mss4-like protein [Tricharina praecox]KAI5842233.1 Mss4-like protein [Tricharina praecox]